MGEVGHRVPGKAFILEMREFAGFPSSAQRYIRRSLELADDVPDAVARWARDIAEFASIRAQRTLYAGLEEVRASIPKASGLGGVDDLMGRLIKISGFDLGQGRLGGFGAYRFLYERIMGPAVRPWLPSAFCAAAALPHMPPAQRGELLMSISQNAATAAGWSMREPIFFPQWVDKVDDMII